MRKLFLIIAIAICMGAITAKGKDRLEKIVQVTQFDKVSLTAGFVVKYTQGLNHECTIFASPKDMEHVKAEVKNNQLYLSVIIDKKKMKKMKYSTSILSEDVIVNVTSPELVKASCVGSGEFIATTDIKSEDVKFDISGTGEIKLKKVTADNMTLTIAGAGDIKIDNIDAVCQKTVLSVAGAGEISASFTDCNELKCSIAGAGEIELKGKVANYSESIAGAGKIKKDGLKITGKSK
ncbi:MAG: DUF2807 domain-containing protein [Prevotella sp.]|nr:DUF2807 domain-containing protein [Prevotella sp.]